MIGFSTKAKAACVAAAVCAFSLAAFGSSFEIEQVFADDNCGITFPAGWHVMSDYPSSVPGVVAAYTDTTRTRIVLLVIDKRTPSGPLDDRFLADFDRDIKKIAGDNRYGGGYIEVAGIRSYERLGGIDSRQGHISTINLLVPGKDRYYDVQGLRFGGAANDDPELQQIIGSFRFLHPFVPSYNSAAYRIGQLMGYAMVILVVVAIMVFTGRSNRTPSRPSPRSPSQPPPLSPGIRLR